MHNIVRRAWPNTRAEHGTITYIWLSSECDWTSGHRKSHKIYTRVHRNCKSGLVIVYKHAAHRLVQHRLQVVEMAWTDDNTLAIFFTCATGSFHHTVVWSPVTNTGTVSQATNAWQIAMQLRYRSSYWIGPWVVSVLVLVIEELDCPWFSHVFNYTIKSVVFEFNIWRNRAK